MNTRMSGTLSRILALTILVLAPLAVAFGVLLPARQTLVDLEAELLTQRTTAARLQAVIAHGKVAVSRPISPEAGAYVADYLTGAQDPVIVAELQNRLRAMAIGYGVELASANALPTKTVDAHSYLGLRAVFRGHLKDIQRTLHTIETTSPLLFVERVVMRLDVRPLDNGDPNGPPALMAELDVYGVRAPTTGGPKP